MGMVVDEHAQEVIVFISSWLVGRQRAEPLGVGHQEGVSRKQRDAASLPPRGLQEEQVDLLQNSLYPGYILHSGTGVCVYVCVCVCMSGN